MIAITDCLKRENIHSTLASENGAKRKTHDGSTYAWNECEGDEEEEIYGPSMVFMAHVEEVAGMDNLMEHDLEAQDDD